MAKHTRRNQIKKPTKEVLVLRKLRIERGLSIRKAAQLMGRSSSWLNHLETGRFDPREIDLRVAARIFDHSISDLKSISCTTSDEDLINLRDECTKIIDRLSHEKLKAVYAMIKIVG